MYVMLYIYKDTYLEYKYNFTYKVIPTYNQDKSCHLNLFGHFQIPYLICYI